MYISLRLVELLSGLKGAGVPGLGFAPPNLDRVDIVVDSVVTTFAGRRVVLRADIRNTEISVKS